MDEVRFRPSRLTPNMRQRQKSHMTRNNSLHDCQTSSPAYYAARIGHPSPTPIVARNASMPDVRDRRLQRYETWAAECDMLARVVTDRTKQRHYEYLAAHYHFLASSFRDALAMHSAVLAKLTLH